MNECEKHEYLMLHPVSGDVYSIPKSSVLFDAGECASVDSLHFVKNAPLGDFSIERSRANLLPDHIIPVKLKVADSAPRAICWMSRLVVRVLNDEIGDELLRGQVIKTTGHRFLFAWSFYHAVSTKLMIENRRDLGEETFPYSHIDTFPCSVGYKVAVTGAGVTPDDILGSKLVEMSNPKNVLTEEEAWFCSIIKPRETVHPRRMQSAMWRQRYNSSYDITALNSDIRQCVRVLQNTQKRKRSIKFLKTDDPHTRSLARKLKFESMPEPMHVDAPASPTAIATATTTTPFKGFDFQSLPLEIAGLICKFYLSDALKTVCETEFSRNIRRQYDTNAELKNRVQPPDQTSHGLVSTFRLICKDCRDVSDVYLGHQMAEAKRMQKAATQLFVSPKGMFDIFLQMQLRTSSVRTFQVINRRPPPRVCQILSIPDTDLCNWVQLFLLRAREHNVWEPVEARVKIPPSAKLRNQMLHESLVKINPSKYGIY